MLERVLKLFDQSGINTYQLENQIGLANGTIKNWRGGKSKPSVEAVAKIAKFFNVTADYLLGTEPTDEEKKQGVMAYYLTPDKEELLMLYEEIGSKLGTDAQKALITYAKFIVDGTKK